MMAKSTGHMNSTERSKWLRILIIGLLMSQALGSVYGAGRQVDNSPLAQAVVKAALRNLGEVRNTIEIEVRRLPFASSRVDNSEVTTAFDSLSVTALTSQPARGLYPVLVEAYLRGQRVNRGQASLYVKVFDSVLVVTSPLKRNQALSADDVELRLMDITRVYETTLSSVEDLDGYQMRRNLRVGKALTQEAMERIPDVFYGDELTIEFRSGVLTMKVRGSALEKGVCGERIKVRNSESGKIIKATVLAPGLVSVTPVGG